ncbi:hypothetical protein CHELA1G2_11484 [Hyphomicrobiales bacterium]|nr:hypothetical protein CHELA1G2_11484 [Hyphomicrobiales bacterium]
MDLRLWYEIAMAFGGTIPNETIIFRCERNYTFKVTFHFACNCRIVAVWSLWELTRPHGCPV